MIRHSLLPTPRGSRAFAAALLLLAWPAHAQITSGTDVNLTKKLGDDTECAIAKNPTNQLQLFALCNTTGTGLAAARSTDHGVTWVSPDPSDGTIADGDAGQGPAAWCDPTLAWDVFGNLFITYISASGGDIVTILSTDGGATFTNLASFAGSVDQPTVVASVTPGPGTPSVWVVWNQGGQTVARGAPSPAWARWERSIRCRLFPAPRAAASATSPSRRTAPWCRRARAPWAGRGPRRSS